MCIRDSFKRVEYRMGFQYDKTYIQLNNQGVKQMAVTLGLGLPLSSIERGAFYKMNITAELGKRGNLNNGLLQERYLNFHLAFTLNDSRWFQRFKIRLMNRLGIISSFFILPLGLLILTSCNDDDLKNASSISSKKVVLSKDRTLGADIIYSLSLIHI